MMKMIKSNIFPLSTASLAFFIVLVMNLKNNLLSTSLLRGLFVFAILFTICYILQIIWQTQTQGLSEKGKFINQITPDGENENLEPLNYEKLSVNEDEEIDQIVKGIRNWSQDE